MRVFMAVECVGDQGTGLLLNVTYVTNLIIRGRRRFMVPSYHFRLAVRFERRRRIGATATSSHPIRPAPTSNGSGCVCLDLRCGRLTTDYLLLTSPHTYQADAIHPMTAPHCTAAAADALQKWSAYYSAVDGEGHPVRPPWESGRPASYVMALVEQGERGWTVPSPSPNASLPSRERASDHPNDPFSSSPSQTYRPSASKGAHRGAGLGRGRDLHPPRETGCVL